MPANETFDIQGINHLALVCKDMKRTVDFYSGVLGMPVTKTITLPNDMGQHFFFDIGNGDQLAFFWFPNAPESVPGVTHAREQSVVRRHKIVAVMLNDEYVALGADAGVDDCEMYSAARKIFVTAAYPESGFRWPLCRDIVRQIDDSGIRKTAENDAFHDGGELALMPDVGRNRYNA